MTTTIALLIINTILLTVVIILFFLPKKDDGLKEKFDEINRNLMKFDLALDKTDKAIKTDFQTNRVEISDQSRQNRAELAKSMEQLGVQFTNGVKDLNEGVRQRFSDFSLQQSEINALHVKQLQEVKEVVEKQLIQIREDNTKQLDEMRRTVDEKLQKTLNERLSQSFETVGKQLQEVQIGLGEMKNLATDVGSLKKVLSNVKMRGSFGEIQLSMLLEQILAPDQYEANVRTKKGSSDSVEFAIKLPGRNEDHGAVWLPVDAKFPKDVYETLQTAYDIGEITSISEAQKALETTIKKMAKDIRDKYIDPPNTTDFAIMFLPFEGIYAEVVRKSALLEELQKVYKVIVTGPTTLAAILNSLQMGFKTLAIQRRSGEVWQVLGEVKKEFQNFGGMMEKAQKNIQTGLSQLDDVMGKRTRAIQRKLKDVENIGEENILPPVSEIPEDENE